MNLSEKDAKYLSKFEKHVKTIYLNYMGAGLSFVLSIVALVIGIKLGSERAMYSAIFFFFISIYIFIVSRAYQRLYKIISDMKRHIEQLENKPM